MRKLVLVTEENAEHLLIIQAELEELEELEKKFDEFLEAGINYDSWEPNEC